MPSVLLEPVEDAAPAFPDGPGTTTESGPHSWQEKN